ncbi:uncharacterized protein N0V89_009740 [Didymosphaeria variabile]|uniref:BTB domain-containing protein n=1 Tax=Didymosphaeria variabile TaxID=1932322 RepID=A0A9W8XFN2_9PLEO|nr:uncharacterized protein N0V89_009740 [Didymosphaeria variabile]KAJ4348366.1 hypothetical protein N0V89_009740 [Didymosphaeria variabile]
MVKIFIEYGDEQLSKAYLHWLYEGTIPCTDSLDNDQGHTFLAKLYVMGEEPRDAKIKNAILDIIAAIAAMYIPSSVAVNII